MDISRFGNKFTCFQCGTKFYDLNKPRAICPKCGKNQANAPSSKAILRSVGVPPEEPDVEPETDDGLSADPEEFPTMEDLEESDDYDLGMLEPLGPGLP